MKRRITALLLVLVMLVMAGCGKSEAATAVDNMILSIGTVTLDSGSQITAVENAIDALSEEQKAELENMAILVAAQTTYADLVEKARVAEVMEKAAQLDEQITAIGTVTLDSGDVIVAARIAYDTADAELQGYVTQLAALEAAEQALSDLRAQQVMELIDAIGNVTKDSAEAIDAAQAAYNALSSNDRALVSNAAALTDAAAALRELQLAEANKLLSGMRKISDPVQNLNWYYPMAFPYYPSYGYWGADVRCFVLPYLGIQGDYAWMRLVCDYTSSDWVFFEKITFAVDDQRYYKYFDYFDVVRDNDWNSIWEYVDIVVGDDEIELLEAIAESTTTIIRFEGDNYYDDFTVTQADKDAIKAMLKVYEAYND